MYVQVKTNEHGSTKRCVPCIRFHVTILSHISFDPCSSNELRITE